MKAALFLPILFASIVSLGAPLSGSDRECACRPHERDLFEEPIQFRFGKFAGSCVDSCRFRRGRVVRQSSRAWVVANFFNLDRYVQARIPIDRVKSVEVGFERFAFGVDHVLLRFEFDREVPYYSQDGSFKRIGTTRRLVISSEGAPAKGGSYKLSEGFFGHYLLVHRLVIGEAMEEWVSRLKHPMRFVKLNLSKKMTVSLLKRGLTLSERESFRTAYRLFSNNCSTAVISLLDAETGFKKQNWDPINFEEFEAALPIAGPLGTEHALSYRKLF